VIWFTRYAQGGLIILAGEEVRMIRGTRSALRVVPLALAIALSHGACATTGSPDTENERFCAAVLAAESDASRRYPAPNTDSREYSREGAAVFAQLTPIAPADIRTDVATLAEGMRRIADGTDTRRSALSDLLAPSDRYGKWLRRHCPGVPSS